MALNLSILYRGPLSSCNYGCDYCPFAKRRETAAELDHDRQALARFVDWVAKRTDDRIGVLFTPWGEALTRSWYREALIRLSHLGHVDRAVAQTNLACGLNWVERCDKTKLALWTTFHPSQVSRADFLARCQELDRRAVRFSVGVVGLRENLHEIESLRAELPSSIYVWINAYKPGLGDLTSKDAERFERVDPLYPINTVRHPSLGKACRTGRSVISVDGDGTVRRCHFVREPIANLYESGFEAALV
ncbi:MAG: STM4011 family radical SAM protein, partial [Isosphaeraceae bacterium]